MNSFLPNVILLFSSLILCSSAYTTSWNNYFRYHPRILRESQECTEEGFFRDSEDCKKFYRCAILPSAAGNRITKYEFRCPDDTVFDEAIATCNYPSQMQNPPTNCREDPPPGSTPGVVPQYPGVPQVPNVPNLPGGSGSNPQQPGAPNQPAGSGSNPQVPNLPGQSNQQPGTGSNPQQGIPNFPGGSNPQVPNPFPAPGGSGSSVFFSRPNMYKIPSHSYFGNHVRNYGHTGK